MSNRQAKAKAREARQLQISMFKACSIEALRGRNVRYLARCIRSSFKFLRLSL